MSTLYDQEDAITDEDMSMIEEEEDPLREAERKNARANEWPL